MVTLLSTAENGKVPANVESDPRAADYLGGTCPWRLLALRSRLSDALCGPILTPSMLFMAAGGFQTRALRNDTLQSCCLHAVRGRPVLSRDRRLS